VQQRLRKSLLESDPALLRLFAFENVFCFVAAQPGFNSGPSGLYHGQV
jgi:hypothetical protein